MTKLSELSNMVTSLLFRIETTKVIGSEIFGGDLFANDEVDGREDAVLECGDGTLFPPTRRDAMVRQAWGGGARRCEEFRLRRRVRRQGRSVMAWVPLRTGVAYLSRDQEICGQCNGRYLDALAHGDDPTPAIRALDALGARAATRDGRPVRPFTPVARQERTLFEVLMSGEYVLHGVTNRELRAHLVRVGFPLAAEAAKQSGQVTGLLRRLHIHQLIATIPRSRRWRLSRNGRRVMAAAVKLREVAYPSLYAEAA